MKLQASQEEQCDDLNRRASDGGTRRTAANRTATLSVGVLARNAPGAGHDTPTTMASTSTTGRYHRATTATTWRCRRPSHIEWRTPPRAPLPCSASHNVVPLLTDWARVAAAAQGTVTPRDSARVAVRNRPWAARARGGAGRGGGVR